MPTRMLHEKICDSVTLAELTGDEERLFHRLVVKADDYGRFHALPSLLLGACFPLLIGKIDVEQVRAWRDRLAEVGLIELYTVNGRDYLQIVTWESYQRQRGSKPKFPAPLEGAESRGELPRAADICGSRVVKTGYPEDDLTVDGRRVSVDDAREPQAAGGADAPPKAKAATKTARRSEPKTTAPPVDLEPNAADLAAGAEVGLSPEQVRAKATAMLDYWRAKGESRADWHATLRTWLRNAPKFDQPARASPANGQAHAASTSTVSHAPVSYLYQEASDNEHAT